MNYTKAMTLILVGIMAVSPIQFTNGEELKIAEETKAENAVETAVETMVASNTMVSADSAVGGISLMLNDYYNGLGEEESGDIYVDGVKMKAVHRVPSPYENLAIANVKTYVNIRSGPSTDYEAIGKLYKGCVANVLGYEGDWVKIQSGNLEEGYIRGDYLLIGWDAEEKIEEHCDKIATVNCSVLNVRTGMSTSDSIYDQIPRGESYYVVEEYEEWVKIVLSQDDNTGAEHTGYVFKQYVDLSYEFQYAVTKEEEAAQKAAEEAARKAEQERLRKLAEEEAARKAAAEEKKKKEEEAKKAAAQAEAEEAQKLLEQQASLSTDAAKLRQEVASYALNFVGNPYVWGGTSLTKGADCSGFVQSIYKQFGYTLPRTSKDQSKSAGYCNVTPDLDHLLPGDLIFYTNSKGVVDHVGLYIGDGKIVHAASKKSGIKISSYKTRTPYKARRVIQ
ncbi:MAG: C40 family peptidase [Lachnospiraceae bacterium]|nr:C40 family peptidase [Lachnospiraceae bacterium]